MARFEPLPGPDEAPTDPGRAPGREPAGRGADSRADRTRTGGGHHPGLRDQRWLRHERQRRPPAAAWARTAAPARTAASAGNGGPGTNGSLAATAACCQRQPRGQRQRCASGEQQPRRANGTVPAANGEGAVTPSGVIVPPPATVGEENRLPIFESVESDWFRRGRHGSELDRHRVEPDGGPGPGLGRLVVARGRGMAGRGGGAGTGDLGHDPGGPARSGCRRRIWCLAASPCRRRRCPRRGPPIRPGSAWRASRKASGTPGRSHRPDDDPERDEPGMEEMA